MKKNDVLTFGPRLFPPVLLILLGLILLVNPDSASVLIAKIIGWILLICGIGFGISALKNHSGTAGKVLGTIVCLGLSGWLLKNPLALAAGIGRFVGILLVIHGVQDVVEAAKLGHGMFLAILTALLGALLVFLPMTTSRLVFSLCGLVVLIVGIAMLIDRLKGRPGLDEGNDPNIIDAL